MMLDIANAKHKESRETKTRGPVDAFRKTWIQREIMGHSYPEFVADPHVQVFMENWTMSFLQSHVK